MEDVFKEAFILHRLNMNIITKSAKLYCTSFSVSLFEFGCKMTFLHRYVRLKYKLKTPKCCVI